MNPNTDPNTFTSVDTHDIIGTIDVESIIKLHDQYIITVYNTGTEYTLIALSDYPAPYSESRIVSVYFKCNVDVCNP
jgi:hypothetical protein